MLKLYQKICPDDIYCRGAIFKLVHTPERSRGTSILTHSTVLELSPTGSLEARPKECRDKVPSIEWLTDAFLIYASVYLGAHPEKTGELLQCGQLESPRLARGVSHGENMMSSLDSRQALNPSSWSKLNGDLWWRCMPASPQTRPETQIPKVNICHF